jgi:hypothetical protein
VSDEPLIITEQFDERGNRLFQTNRPVDANNPSDWKILKEAGLPVEVIEWTKEHLEWHEKMEREAAKRVRRAKIAHVSSVSIIFAFLGVSAYFLYFGNAVLAGSMLLGWAVSEIIVMEVLIALRRGKNATD